MEAEAEKLTEEEKFIFYLKNGMKIIIFLVRKCDKLVKIPFFAKKIQNCDFSIILV